MNQTKKRAQCALSATEIHLPGWNQKQRHDFIEAVKIHGLKKLKKLQRHIGSKTQEDVRIAVELYKREVRNRELTMDMERQIEEAGVTNEDYKTWLYFYMASQSHRNDHAPVAALEAFLDQNMPKPKKPKVQLHFPNWRQAEIEDFLATVELAKIITNIAQHIPTKTELEITGATDAYTIICDARNHAMLNGQHVPTLDELKPGYIYLQCIVAALSENEKLRKLEIAPGTDPDMARAKFVLKEYLMPDCGMLPNGWTEDEKYSLLVAIEAFGKDLARIQAYFPWKTKLGLKNAISAIKKENEFNEGFYEKKRAERYLSLASWGSTLILCTESKMQIVAAKRLIFALKELPEPQTKGDFMKIYQSALSEDEMTSAVLNMCMQDTKRRGRCLIPLLEAFVSDIQAKSEPATNTTTPTPNPTNSRGLKLFQVKVAQ